jgi:hypothetical protein
MTARAWGHDATEHPIAFHGMSGYAVRQEDAPTPARCGGSGRTRLDHGLPYTASGFRLGTRSVRGRCLARTGGRRSVTLLRVPKIDLSPGRRWQSGRGITHRRRVIHAT